MTADEIQIKICNVCGIYSRYRENKRKISFNTKKGTTAELEQN